MPGCHCLTHPEASVLAGPLLVMLTLVTWLGWCLLDFSTLKIQFLPYELMSLGKYFQSMKMSYPSPPQNPSTLYSAANVGFCLISDNDGCHVVLLLSVLLCRLVGILL